MEIRSIGTSMIPANIEFDESVVIDDPHNTCPSCRADGLLEIMPDHTDEFIGIQCLDCGFFARVRTSD